MKKSQVEDIIANLWLCGAALCFTLKPWGVGGFVCLVVGLLQARFVFQEMTIEKAQDIAQKEKGARCAANRD